MGAMRNAYNTVVGKPEGKNHSEDLGVDGKIISEWILWTQDGKMRPGFIWLKIGTSGTSCEHGNEPQRSIRGGKFLAE
jgi:hypothetical protein